MATFLYGRCSTTQQDTDNQLSKLREQYPAAEVVEETASGIKSRPKLKELIERLQRDDVLVVPALDRLGRRTSEVLTMIEELDARGIILRSVREGVDYGTITGKLVTQILCSVSELERNLISQRTKVALEAKRKKGIVGGRPKKFGSALIEEAKMLRAKGETLKSISNQTGISVSRLHQLLKDPSPRSKS